MSYLPYLFFICASLLFVILEQIFKKQIFKDLCFAAILIVFMLLAVLRANTVGTDTSGYSNVYDTSNQYSLSQFLAKYKFEYLFYFFLYLFGSILKINELVFRIFCYGLICSCLFFAFYKRHERSFALTIFLFIGYFCMSFSGVRQAIAMAISTLALTIFIEYRFKKEFLRYVVFYLLIIVSFLFHETSMILVIFPIFMVFDLKPQQSAFITILAIPFVFVFGRILIFVADLSEKENFISSSRISITLVLEIVFLWFIYLFYFCNFTKKIREKLNINDYVFEKNESDYIWLMYGSILGYCFNVSSTVVARFGMYFYLALPVLSSKVLKTIVNKKLYLVVKYSVIVVFALYFIYSLPTLKLVPYVFK